MCHQDTDLEIHVLQNLTTLTENKVIQVKPCWVGLGTIHKYPLMQTPISVCLSFFLSFFDNRQVSKRDLERKKCLKFLGYLEEQRQTPFAILSYQ